MKNAFFNKFCINTIIADLMTERKRLTIRSIVVTLTILACVVVLNVFWDRMLYAFAAVFLLSGASRIAGKIIYDRNTGT